MAIPFGVSSMVARLRHVLVQRPTEAFAGAFDAPGGGYRRPVDIDAARKEHAAFVELLTSLDVTVHQLDADSPHPDQIYTYDPALVTEHGAILLRSGKAGRRGEEGVLEAWFQAHGIPVIGAIEAPGTVDGGDVFWLRPGLVCAGRTLRTNQAGVEQLRSLLDEDVVVFDVPYDAGPEACLHLMSLISMIADDLALVERRRLPAGLHALLAELRIATIPVPDSEVETLGTNVLATSSNVVVAVAGNPITRSRLEAAGAEVHEFAGDEIALNGTGGPTCLTRPLHRA